ncbi:hypothetical protein HMPREF9372_0042 [Sporosarcina newyorkensis 2681]|uniref:Uncharacterized protein n=1 Tax=Sporosarcina newyorkensis 2681 TaxID=1027292 RepID=F9DML2_9BACL|nr:hypothetical protein [Sporosarcina newyorkensis]EGQ27934.1 hypothetical protein HMPREF9372_0042 [Sporosarcina newyorkensis 2681]
MNFKYKKLLTYLFSIGVVIIISFCINKYLTHFSTREEAIEKYLLTVFENDPAQLIDVVETDISNTYYLLLRTNGSDVINTTANVKIKNNIFGWKVTAGYEKADADLTKHLIDRETNTLK